MKNYIKVLLILIISSNLFALAGFGLNLDRSLYSVNKSTTPLIISNIEVATIIHHGFDNGFGIGGYLYIDAIPMVDLDIEGKILMSPYDFSFSNSLASSSINNKEFGWVDLSGYLTLQKKHILSYLKDIWH